MTIKFLRGFVDRMLYRQPPGGWEQDLWYVQRGAVTHTLVCDCTRLSRRTFVEPLQEQIHCALVMGQRTRTGPAL